MPHSWIWRRSEMDSGHWGIWELLQHGIDRYKVVAVVVAVESFVVVTALDDLSLLLACVSIRSWALSPHSQPRK